MLAVSDNANKNALDLIFAQRPLDLALIISNSKKLVFLYFADAVKNQNSGVSAVKDNVSPFQLCVIRRSDDRFVPPRNKQRIHAVSLRLDLDLTPLPQETLNVNILLLQAKPPEKHVAQQSINYYAICSFNNYIIACEKNKVCFAKNFQKFYTF